MWRLRSEVQPLTLLYTTFDKKGTPFVHLPLKMVSLSHTKSKSSFHYMSVFYNDIAIRRVCLKYHN